MKKFALYCFFVLGLMENAAAQTVEEVAKLYPNEMTVMTKMYRETKIKFENGVPVANSTEEMEFVVLDDRANGIYNKYHVYHGDFDVMSDLEAYTRVPDGSRYKKIKVAETKTQNSVGGSVFYDDVKETVFDFPSLVKGAYAYESHKEFHKDLHLLSPFYFASYMPILDSKFTLSFPADMDVKYIIKNDKNNKITVREDKKGKTRILEFSAANIKMMDRFSNGPARAYYEPHVIVYIASYTDDNNTQVPYLGSLQDLYNWNYNFLKEVNQKPDANLKRLADSITMGAATEKEKAKRIYRWVQQHIKYVAFEEGLEGFIPRQATDVCNKRYGDCKDMSSLLTALLQQAGLDAHFTWIGTRDIPYEYTEVHLPIVDNHMICAVKLNDNWTFLDGTDPNCEFGLPTYGIQGKQALIAFDEKKYEVVRVPEIEALKNRIVDSTFISVASSGIKGSTAVYYHGYIGNDLLNNLESRDSKDMKEFVKYKVSKGSNKFILGDYKIDLPKDDSKSVAIKASFEVPDYGKKLGDEYYINMNLDKFYTGSVIDTAKRKIPVEYNYRYNISQYTILDIPDNFTVSYLPKDFSLKNDLMDFNIHYSKKDNKIVASQEIISKMLFLTPGDFNAFNNSVKELLNQYKEQVVLQKK